MGELQDIAELSGKAKELEEVNKLKDEKVLKNRIPQEFLQELGEVTSA